MVPSPVITQLINIVNCDKKMCDTSLSIWLSVLFNNVCVSLCRLIYPGFEITQFFVHLILRII